MEVYVKVDLDEQFDELTDRQKVSFLEDCFYSLNAQQQVEAAERCFNTMYDPDLKNLIDSYIADGQCSPRAIEDAYNQLKEEGKI